MPTRSLEGITFGFTDFSQQVVHDPTVSSLHEQLVAHDELLRRHAVALGGSVLDQPYGGESDYRLNSIWEGSRTKVHHLLRTITDLPRMEEVTFGSLDNDAVDSLKAQVGSGNKYVFAYQNCDRGHAKYLIEEPHQVEVVHQLGRSYASKTGNTLYGNFVVRPYVETPSKHYTSYRLAATAAGEVQAAGLLYSGHAKNYSKRMIHTCENDGDERLQFMVDHFENPDSDYFLNARDVRSNIMCGGSMIALMGENRQQLKNGEAAILEVHGLDPALPEPPKDIVRYAQMIGSVIAPSVDLVLGIDFIQDAYDNRYLLEVNYSPTGHAYNICHLGGQADMVEAMHIARLQVIDQLALRS